MIVIGVDPHKETHTATAVDEVTNTNLGSIRIRSTLEDYARLLVWAQQWPKRRWAVENARGLGHHLALWLVAQREHVVDVPSTSTARVRQLSRGNRRKNDRIDAAAAACVAALQGDGYPVVVEDHTDVLRILDERRRSLVSQSIRVRNQLHALLRELVPGGAKTDLDSEKAAVLLRFIAPNTPSDAMRKAIALEMVGDLRRLHVQVLEITERTQAVLADCETSLLAIHGVGPVMAGRILAHTGNPFRFPSEAAFANFTGTAPIEVSSADNTRHRLSRGGDRTLNAAVHIVAVCQARTPGSEGHTYYHRKISEGKTPRAAQRCLKRQVVKRLWAVMRVDEVRRASASRSHLPPTRLARA
ncbi:IS110 family transposase [Rhodococcus sp. BP22]|uniref:IS110 family transposase n=1 Tax=Rhodococcus sp. BP22 TaxID=2758566 RepID=UPI001648C976|nr:IS110 family transposase [Rhodococcus sp. BP22]